MLMRQLLHSRTRLTSNILPNISVCGSLLFGDCYFFALILNPYYLLIFVLEKKINLNKQLLTSHMAKIWQKDIKYFILRPFVDWCTKRNYTCIKVEGFEKLPKNAAVILTPNHCNSLMDALVVLQSNPGPSAFGARADIFKNKSAAKFLRFLKIVPLARIRDGAAAVKTNLDVFDEIVDIIDHDVPFCLYGEGTHHASHNVMPIKKGIWRIAELAQEKLDKPVYVVPMGIDYKFFFRIPGPVEVRYGDPIKFSDVYPDGPIKFSQNLHEKIQELVRREDLDHINEDESACHYKAPKLSASKAISKGLLGLLLLPFAIIWGVLGFPMTVISNILIGKMKDKTWSNTIRFGVRFLMLILLTLIYGILAFIFLKWYWALLLLVMLHYSDTAFNWHLNYYKDLFIHE